MILGREEILKLLKSVPPLVEDYIDLEKQLQPAGFDLTLNSVYSLKGEGVIDFSNERRVIPDWEPITFDDTDGKVKLRPGAYVVSFNERVNLPLDIAAIARPRSSLLRMGASLFTALWDPGYSGRSKALLVVFNPAGITVYRNARIAQLVFIRVRGGTGGGYKGTYQYED